MRHEAWCSHASSMGGAAMAAAVRLGVIVPSVNIVVEEWYPTAVPAGVSLHFARMLMPEGSSPERIIEMDRTDGVRAIRQLATCRPHALAYGCTASSIVQGHAFDAHLREEIRDIAGCPGTSATHSIFTACEKLGLKRVSRSRPTRPRSMRRSTASSPRAASRSSPARISASATASDLPSQRRSKFSIWLLREY